MENCFLHSCVVEENLVCVLVSVNRENPTGRVAKSCGDFSEIDPRHLQMQTQITVTSRGKLIVG